MYTVKETIIVEGIYDKIKLSAYVDSLIFVTYGFSFFNNKKAQASVKTFAEKNGIVILTDSDSAGLKIRNFLKQLVPNDKVKHAYIPEIFGKERRKTSFSKEKLLGVEGMDGEILVEVLRQSGCTINGEKEKPKEKKAITKTDFFSLGLSGGNGSSEIRHRLALALGLPSKLSANMLLDAVNSLLTKDELINMVKDLRGLNEK